MATRKIRIRRGVQLWLNSSHPSTAWLELGRRNADHFLSLDLIGIAFLALLKPPWNTIAVTVAKRNRSKVRAKLTSRGVWIKMSIAHPFQKARKRTRNNMNKKPSPW